VDSTRRCKISLAAACRARRPRFSKLVPTSNDRPACGNIATTPRNEINVYAAVAAATSAGGGRRSQKRRVQAIEKDLRRAATSPFAAGPDHEEFFAPAWSFGLIRPPIVLAYI